MTRETVDLKRPELLKEAAYIGGEWVTSDHLIDVRNPATGSGPVAAYVISLDVRP